MDLMYRLLITEVIVILVGLLICLLRQDEPVPDTAGMVGALMVVLSALALIVTVLWWVWTH